MTAEREPDRSADVERKLDEAENADTAERLETIEKIHDELEKELDSSGDTPSSGL